MMCNNQTSSGQTYHGTANLQ